ncbi:MAG: DNA repair protein RecN [Desulfobacteraceae bacterium]|nr:MAG: DNA repair protein RecN [Desulfobacteraceae bacterium]
MLSTLTIKNFAIIDDIKIDFSNGLSVLTGETGAGKSIIIQAVNLLLGHRASSDLVRKGHDTAELEAFFDIDPDGASAGMLTKQGLDPQDGLIIRRLISNSAKGKIFINGRQSTVAILKEVTANLAGISSQHAHQELLNPESHLDILDRFADTHALRSELKSLYNNILPMKKELDQLRSVKGEDEQEIEFLMFQIDEIESADIQPDEDQILDEKRRHLLSATGIFNTLVNALDQFHEKEGAVLEMMNTARHDLDRYRETDPELAKLSDRLGTLLFDLEDIISDLRGHADGIDMDPESLDRVEQRLDLIQKLKRKYGPTLDDLQDTHETLKERLDGIRQSDQRMTLLAQEIRSALDEAGRKAKALSEKRSQTAGKLADLAQSHLADLEMDKAVFQVQVAQDSADESWNGLSSHGHKLSPAGIDRVTFLLSPNPGEDPKPLNRIASGGELSRIVLALKAALSGVETQQTLIFDEVDAGVGGATAEKVGKKLADLAASHQVICITHLAQIAKYADEQYRITKTVDAGRTSTRILPLTSMDQRVAEIARMIAGSSVSDAALSHARDLLANQDHRR